MSASSSWATVAERGSVLGLRFLVFCYRGVGRRVSGWLLYPIVAYFVATGPGPRRASRRYLERLRECSESSGAHQPLIERPGLVTAFRHLFTFAELALDRLCFWAGRYDDFDIGIHGVKPVTEYLDAGQGVVLIGAHLGSFDVLRVLARDEKVAVNAVMFTENAQRINETFKQLDPECDLKVIQIDPTSVRSAFEIKGCLERGELVAFLGDRVDPGGRGRACKVPFLGVEAPFPESPFLLPMVFGSPVFLSLAMRSGPRKYDIFFELLAKPARIPRARRGEVLEERVSEFAQRLEHYCAKAPYQWFNFYDYWQEDREIVA